MRISLLSKYIGRLEQSMIGNRNFAMMGIGVAAAVLIFLPSCTSFFGKNKEVGLQNFVGTWEFVSVTSGDETQDNPPGGLQLELKDGKIFAGIPGGNQVELTPVEEDKLEGTIGLLGTGENDIQIPITVELDQDTQELNFVMMISKVDKSSLPVELKGEFSQDVTFVAKQTTEPLDVEQAAKGRQSAVKSHIGAMNRAQQAYYLEKGSFASNLEDLGIGIKSETESYSYSINQLEKTGVQLIAIPKNDELTSYTGGVFAVENEKSNSTTTVAILCESEAPSKGIPLPPVLVGEELQCPAGFRSLN